jgi:mono/diheme cytochrome c family protein
MRNDLMCAAVLLAAVAATSIGAENPPAGAVQNTNSWLLGEDADTKTNPLAPDAKTLAAGKAVYKDKCQRCHGPGGVGDGPDSEPEAREDMDLTNPKRTGRNPDGVVYYKVLNGRKRPHKMPAFKDELTEQQIWSVVAYAQSLRKTP